MRAVNKLFDFFYHLIAGSLCAWALSLAIIAATVIDFPQLPLLGICAAFMTAFYLLFWNKRIIIIFFVCLSVALAVTCLYVVINRFEVEWYRRMMDSLRWLIALSRNRVPYKSEYALSMAVLISFLMCLLTSLNTRVYFNVHLPALVAVAVFTVPAITGWGSSDTAILLFVLGYLMLLCRKLNLQAQSRENSDGPGALYAFGLVPLCVLAFGLAFVMPKPSGVSGGKAGVDGIFQMAEELAQGLSASGRAQSFSREGEKLGGPVSMNNQFVMEVDAPGQLYLSGSVRDAYTGTAWECSDSSRESLTPGEYMMYDTTAYSKGMVSAQEYYMRFYDWQSREVKIRQEARTRILYTPPFASLLVFNEEIGLSRDAYGQLQTDNLPMADASYIQNYVDWKYTSPYFANILREQGGAAANREAALKDLPQYLALPQSLPPRVGELAQELTKEFSNDYDKLLALRQYLAQFPYTLEPDKVPSGEDFVDYFLFEGEEGYCVYFASALAVMARTLDIPTRYVEGFILPETRNSSGSYTVTNSQSHAWMEAYFAGFGWVVFDATPSYSAQMNSAETEPAPSPEIESNTETPSEPEAASKPEGFEADKAEPPAQQPSGDRPWAAGLFAILATVCLTVCFVWLLASRYRARSLRMRSLSGREGVLAYFAGIVRVAEALDYPMKMSETALTYAGRVGDAPVFVEHQIALVSLAELFSRAAYSEQPIADSDREQMKAGHDTLLQALRRAPKQRLRYRLRYFVGRYLLNRY